jgi:hypothetical protein
VSRLPAAAGVEPAPSRRSASARINPQHAVRKVLEIVKALPPEQVFGSEAELDICLDAMQQKVRGDS